MRTKKLCSTISYNSKEFLIQKLNELIKNHKISFWCAIRHKGEKDETPKDHYHLILEPNTLLDTMDLQNYLKEFDPDHPDKPLGCINFRSSKNYDEWILYGQHYIPYLATLMQSREFTYLKEDFFSSDPLTFDDLYHHAFYGSEFAHKRQILEQLAEFESDPITLIKSGAVPLSLAPSLNAYKYMQTHYGLLDRNGRVTHSPLDNNKDSAIINIEVSEKNYI